MSTDHLTPDEVGRTTAAAYENLRRFPDRALAQIVIADEAVDVAETAMTLACDRDGREHDSDLDAAARLVANAQSLLSATVLAARLDGKSWEAIGEAVTGESGKKQTMINRYGHLEAEWREALLEPVEFDRHAWGGRGVTRSRTHDALTGDLRRQVQRLQEFLDQHRPGRELGLPEDSASLRVSDYLWRLNATTTKYGLGGIPPELAADIDARKTRSLADSKAYLQAAERAAGKTTTEPDEEA
jgi:hypothetical protein